jgi:hypothetical protein
MEDGGWLQGSMVSANHTQIMTSHFDALPGDILLVVASQSCDVANNSEEDIEFSIARKIENIDGNYAFNKHPRILHIPAYIKNEDGIVSEIYLELRANEKVCIPKKKLLELNIDEPCKLMTLKNEIIDNYVDWLAARYKRPALPSEFDRRVDQAWGKKKRERDFLKSSEHIKGIYIEISPSEEIKENEAYSVNLLVLITDEAKESTGVFDDIETLIKSYIDKMKTVRINTITHIIDIESRVSLASFNRYKRVNLDSLSYKNNHPLPPELRK